MYLLNPYLRIKRSGLPGCGKGLFTKIFIPKGIIITEHIGKVISLKEANHDNHYLFYVTRNHVIDASNQHDAPARFANDARGYKRIPGFSNNAKYVIIGKQVFIIAARDIKPNEEIFVGYGKEYWDVMKLNYSLQ